MWKWRNVTSAKAIETKEMKNRTTAPSSSWTGKQHELISRGYDDYDDDDEEKRMRNWRVNSCLQRVWWWWRGWWCDIRIWILNRNGEQNHGDQAKTQVSVSCGYRKRTCSVNGGSSGRLRHGNWRDLGPNDREAIKSIRKQIERGRHFVFIHRKERSPNQQRLLKQRQRRFTQTETERSSDQVHRADGKKGSSEDGRSKQGVCRESVSKSGCRKRKWLFVINFILIAQHR